MAVARRLVPSTPSVGHAAGGVEDQQQVGVDRGDFNGLVDLGRLWGVVFDGDGERAGWWWCRR
jgi:hypothetical protein